MRKLTRALALCVSLCVVLTALPAAVSARTYSDVSTSHWAYDKINQWSDKGYMQGYPDGTFRPEGDITRAEFVKITNNAFGFSGAANINFTDVNTAFWGYGDIRTASSMGYINGYPDGTFRPNGNITRQEAAKIICSILGLEENPAATYGFADYTNIDDWARGYVGAVYANKIMGRYSDGTFKARQKLTRAECVEGLWNGVDKHTGQSQAVEDLTVTAATYVGTGDKKVKNLSINYAGDVTVENLTVQGDVTITSRVGDSLVTFKNCTILGTLYLEYGSLELQGVTLNALRLSSNKATRTVTLKGITTVQTAQTDRAVTIDQSGVTGTGAGVQLLYVGDSVAATTTLKGGTFPRIIVSRKDQGLVLTSGTITRLECDYSGLDVLLGQGTVLGYLALEGSGAVIEGPGTVSEANLAVRGATFQRNPDTLSGIYSSFDTTGDWRLGFTVTDTGSGKAISGAKVTLGAGWATGTTNSSGYVEFKSIPDRDIVYTITATDYKELTGTAEATGGHRYPQLSLAPSGSWKATLTVLDSAGNGIPGAYACMYNTAGTVVQTSSTSNTYTSGGVAKSDGQIIFDGLGSSTYTYKVFAPGYAASDSQSFTIYARDNDNAGTVVLYRSRVELRLLSSYDNVTQISSFRVRDPNTNAWITATPGGVAVFEGLAAGTYNLTVQLTGTDKDSYVLDNPAQSTTTVRITVSESDYAGSGVAAKTATLTPNITYTYTVNVTNLDGSARIENATLKLQSALTGYNQTITLGVSDGGRAYFTQVPMSKDYVLTVTAGGYSSYSKSGLTVDAASLTHQAQLTGLRTVTLFIQDDLNNPVSGMTVSLTGATAVAAQVTNAAGQVTFQNVPEGVYSVTGTHSTLQLPKNAKITVYESMNQVFIAEGIQVTFTLRLQRSDTGGGTALPSYVTLVARGSGKSYSQSGSGGSFTFTLPMGVYDITLPAGFALTITNDFINLTPAADSAIITVLVTGT